MKKIALCFFLLLMSCTQETVRPRIAEEVTGMENSKKAVFIIASSDFRDEEYNTPKEILEKANIKVITASSRTGEITGMLGGKAAAEVLYSSVNPAEYDAVVFIGGTGASEYWNDPAAHELARGCVEKGKILAAICIAPVTLANAGLLAGKRSTVFSSEGSKLKSAGAIYTGKNVEVDGKIITGAGPFAAKEFGKEILKAILQ
ncbi:MAG: DJ-1/PfpI family protein [bacterium]